jgi:tripeptidyl-peptidase-1
MSQVQMLKMRIFLAVLLYICYSDPPLANSMSWGSIEQDQSTSVLNSFNTEALKLGSIGVTVTISSGDDGVSNSNCACTTNSGSSQSSWTGAGSWTGEGYFPNFPASCPYVTALGASMGAGGYPPAVGGTEIACQSQLGGVITSGGGFSTYYAQPTWQTSAVSTYLAQFNVSSTPASGYNKNGRGIPDMAMLGVYYQVVLAGSIISLFGTSCSSPVTSALVSLINAARAAKGLGSVGFMNPTFYTNTVRMFARTVAILFTGVDVVAYICRVLSLISPPAPTTAARTPAPARVKLPAALLASLLLRAGTQ